MTYSERKQLAEAHAWIAQSRALIEQLERRIYQLESRKRKPRAKAD